MILVDIPRSDEVESPSTPFQSVPFIQKSWAGNLAVGRADAAKTLEIPTENDVFNQPLDWFAVFIHGRREERFKELMDAAGVTCFLPRVLKRIRHRRWERGRRHEFRWEKRWVPYIPNYAFIGTPRNELAKGEAIYAAKATGIVYRISPPAIQALMVKALRSIRDRLESDPEHRQSLRPGRYRIGEGAFRGCTGDLVKQRGANCTLRGNFLFNQIEDVTFSVELLDPV